MDLGDRKNIVVLYLSKKTSVPERSARLRVLPRQHQMDGRFGTGVIGTSAVKEARESREEIPSELSR
jgi:hypothetical protein